MEILFFHNLLKIPDLNMTYNNSDIISYSGSFEFRIRTFSFEVYTKTKSRNCVLAFFAEPSYKIIENQLKNESIPRNERIQIMDSYSKMSLCNTGAFVNHNSIECTFKLEGNGTLVFFPEATKYGEYSIISHYFLCSKLKEVFCFALLFYSLMALGFSPIIVIICIWVYYEKKKEANGNKEDTSITNDRYVIPENNDNTQVEYLEPDFDYQALNEMHGIHVHLNENDGAFRVCDIIANLITNHPSHYDNSKTTNTTYSL